MNDTSPIFYNKTYSFTNHFPFLQLMHSLGTKMYAYKTVLAIVLFEIDFDRTNKHATFGRGGGGGGDICASVFSPSPCHTFPPPPPPPPPPPQKKEKKSSVQSRQNWKLILTVTCLLVIYANYLNALITFIDEILLATLPILALLRPAQRFLPTMIASPTIFSHRENEHGQTDELTLWQRFIIMLLLWTK